MCRQICSALILLVTYTWTPNAATAEDESPYADPNLVICGVVKDSGDYNSCLMAVGRNRAYKFNHQCRNTGECVSRNGTQVCVNSRRTTLPFEESQVFIDPEDWNKRFYTYRPSNPSKGEIDKQITTTTHTCYISYKCKTFCEFDPIAGGGGGKFACVPSLEIIKDVKVKEYKEGEVCPSEDPNDPENPDLPENPDMPGTPDVLGNPGDATAPINEAILIFQ